MDVGEEDLDYAVDFHQVARSRFKELPHLSDNELEALRQKSAKRVNESEEFVKLQGRIERYLQQKADKKVSLNREKFNARRKEFDAQQADLDALEEQLNSDSAVKRTYYLEEVLGITVDYIKALEKKVARVKQP